ncbi:hypothetical protein NB643_04640 [Oxalobacter aliiformigenes]|nr:hypothetical protein [Oxalobacter aliiformigenes]WAV96040.1 hypothetical protein NB643_04640 [Oxalobacter aliiformigenes]
MKKKRDRQKRRGYLVHERSPQKRMQNRNGRLAGDTQNHLSQYRRKRRENRPVIIPEQEIAADNPFCTGKHFRQAENPVLYR